MFFLLQFWFGLLGNSLFSLKLLTWTILVTTDLIIYKLATRISPGQKFTPYLATLVFVLLNLGFGGNALWFDLVVTLLFVLCCLFLESKQLFLAGVAFGLAIVTKQTSLIGVIPISTYIKSQPIKARRSQVTQTLLGLLIIVLPTLFYLAINYQLRDFFLWVFKFAPVLSQYSYKPVTQKGLLLSTLFIIQLSLCLKKKPLLAAWGIVGLFFLFPRFEYFHLQPMLPFFALALVPLAKKNWKFAPWLILFPVLIIATRSIIRDWHKPDRFYEQDSLSIISWIRSHSSPGEKIFLLNTWDQIYLLTNTLPATKPWFHYLPWYLKFDSVQDKIVSDLNSIRPKLIISQNLPENPQNQVESFVLNNYQITTQINQQFTVWQPK